MGRACSYPILSCVSKNFRDILRSPEIHKIRSLLDKDSLYFCFTDETTHDHTRNWFTLRRIKNNPTENRFVSVVSIAFDERSEPSPWIIAIGPEIFFICGSILRSSSMWIFDSRSQRFRRGPNMQVNRNYKTVGLVGGKIYVIGGYKDGEIKAESFDLRTETWEPAAIPKARPHIWISNAAVSLDKRVYALTYHDVAVTYYDPRDGSCGSFELPKDKWWNMGVCVCVLDNVLYVHYARFGLMWYDSELKLWIISSRKLEWLNIMESYRFRQCLSVSD